jgi:excinuclease Cho
MESQVEVWPFAGAVDLIEKSGDWIQKHRINNWCYLGTRCSQTNNTQALGVHTPHDFDLDSYKILVRPIMLGAVKVAAVLE